jgi:hypothetical protein
VSIRPAVPQGLYGPLLSVSQRQARRALYLNCVIDSVLRLCAALALVSYLFLFSFAARLRVSRGRQFYTVFRTN